MHSLSASAVTGQKRRARGDLTDSPPPETKETDDERRHRLRRNTIRHVRRGDPVGTAGKRRVSGDLSESPLRENEETECERGRRLSRNRYRRTRQRCRPLRSCPATINPAGSNETAAARGNSRDLADDELLQNNSAAIIENGHGKSDVTDSSPADPGVRNETIQDRHRRLDCERKRRVRHADGNSDLADCRRRLDRERKRRRVKNAQGNSEVIDRIRQLDRERKRRYRERNPNTSRRHVNFKKRLDPVNVKPAKLCNYCDNNFLLYAHESAGFCCGKGTLTSLHSQCFEIPHELISVYTNKWFGPWSRMVNNTLRFSSPGSVVRGGMFMPPQPAHLRCCGQTYTRILSGDVGGPLRAWINDTSLQLQEFDNLPEEHCPTRHITQAKSWTATISDYLQRFNPFALSLMSMGQDSAIEAIKFNFTHRSKHMEQKRLSSEELALVHSTMHRNDNTELFATVIPKQKSEAYGLSNRIHYHSGFWETLAYPLLFLDGQIGWGHLPDGTSIFTKLHTKNGITLHEYTKYLLLHSPIISHAGRLRQAWVLEQYLRDQHNTLDYLRRNNTLLKRARRSVVEGVLYTVNMIKQREMAINLLSEDERAKVSYLEALPEDVKERVNFESLIIEGHDHHHEDTNETFTASDLKYLPGYTYLPSSYPGGPRSQMLKFADAMTTAAKLGGPHLFTTFTTSPTWLEFRDSTSNAPYVEDNMVVENRVFKEKLALFLDDLRAGVFFEERQAVYMISVVEFQWRGHPHAHIVHRLQGDRLTADEINRMITTSYTQCKTQKETKLLETFMTHHCKRDLCLKDGKPCCLFYPKKLNPTYQIGDHGYPLYKRLNEEDRRIVPCVLDMTTKYNCHINTEICSDVFIIEYLFKYIYKGNVRLQVQNVSTFVDNEMDSRIPNIVRERVKEEMKNNFRSYEKNEINRFELMHCIPATQATWKFLGYRTSQNQPGVHVIDIELPGNEVVHFKPNNITSMEETIANKVSAQDIYWNRPAGEEFDILTLEKFFDTYVVEHVERRSTKSLMGEIFIPRSEVLQRKQDMQLFVYSRRKTTSSLTQTINRMKFVSPACGDLYYLRMLLRHYPSRSWVDARTVKGNVHDTCHDACVAMCIVSNNTEFDVIMQEAIANLFVSDKLRRLFVMVLLQKYAQSKANFIKYAAYMSLDFYEARNIITPVCQGKPMMALLHQFTFYDMPYDIQQDLLRAIEEMFVENNLEMEAYGLPLPTAPAEAELEREKTKYNIDAITRMLDSVVLNREQKKIVKYIFRHTDNIFIDAPFGRGKSFLLDYILGHIRVRKSMIALAVAPTGVMAIERGGFTMHGIVNMSIEPDDADRLQYHVGDNSQRAALIRGAHYLIIEEGPNAHRRIWESLDRACRDIRKNGSPFGGLRVITAGDFRQIPPPIKSCDERDIYNASVKSWPVFRKFTVLHLSQPIRTANDKEWTKVCDDLGNGKVQPVVPNTDGRWTSIGLSKWVDLPQTIWCYDAETQLQAARDWVHPDVNNYDAVIVSALVAMTNKQVDEHNNYFLSKVNGESRVMESSDQILSEMPTDVKCIIADFADAMTHNRMPPSKLLLKVNGIYTCMRSINFGRKLMNGTIVRIVSMTDKYITVYNYTTGLEDDIPRICFKQNINSKSPLKISRRQFPLRSRYSMTSNIVQGKTIEHMLLDLRHDPFAHGQLHVSCSRVPQASQLRVLTFKERIINNRARTLNVVVETFLKAS